jgi:hypothetical protein
MWLAPFVNPKAELNLINGRHFRCNTIVISFEKPLIFSAVKFWNYAKTPARGVRELEIYLDDRIIYKVIIKILNLIVKFQTNIPCRVTSKKHLLKKIFHLLQIHWQLQFSLHAQH